MEEVSFFVYATVKKKETHFETVMARNVFSTTASLTLGDTWMIPRVGPGHSLSRLNYLLPQAFFSVPA